MDRIMPTFDPEIARIAERLLIKPRAIDYRTGVFASKVTPGTPRNSILSNAWGFMIMCGRLCTIVGHRSQPSSPCFSEKPLVTMMLCVQVSWARSPW